MSRSIAPEPSPAARPGRARRALRALATLLCLGLGLALLAPSLLGYRQFVITGDSMGTTIPRGSVAIEEVVPVSEIAVGDVITYVPPAGSGPTGHVTHRVISISASADGRRSLRTQGDANADPDPWRFTLDGPEQARVVLHLPLLGYVIAALGIGWVRILALVLPAAAIALSAIAGAWADAGRELERRRGLAPLPPGPARPGGGRRLAMIAAALGALVVSAAAFAALSRAAATATTANPQNTFTAGDWTAPQPAIALPAQLIATRTPVISGTAGTDNGDERQVTVRLFAGGTATGTAIQAFAAVPVNAGAWAVTAATLADGTYTVEVGQLDDAGNEGRAARTFTVDATPPATTITSGPSGPTTVASPSFAFTSSESPASFECRLNGPGATTGSWTACTTPRSLGPLADGAYTFSVRSSDAAGNTDPVPPARSFVVDTTAPATGLTVPSGTLQGTVGMQSSPSDPGTAATGVASVTVQVAPAGSGSWSDACTATASPWLCTWDSATVTEGSYDFRAVARDAAGNSGHSAVVTRSVENRKTLIYAGTGAAASRTSSGSVNVPYPSGTVAGDLLLLVEVNAANQGITTPTGWTLIADQATSSPAQLRFTVWWAVAGTGSSVPLTISTNSAGASAWVARWSRPAGAAPAPVLATTAVRQGPAGAVSTLTPSPDLTTSGTDSTVISIVANRSANALSLQTPRSFATQLTTTHKPNTQSVGLGIADRILAAAGTPASPTWAQGGTAAQWAWATVAFR